MKKHNLRQIAKKAMSKAQQVAAIAMVASAAYVTAMSPAFAADAKQIFDVIIKVVGGFAIAMGAFRAVTGAIAYADAKEEGEGPAMAKARNQLTAAILLVIIGIAAEAGASTLAGLLSSISL